MAIGIKMLKYFKDKPFEYSEDIIDIWKGIMKYNI